MWLPVIQRETVLLLTKKNPENQNGARVRSEENHN
jgi:hypothetical protein